MDATMGRRVQTFLHLKLKAVQNLELKAMGMAVMLQPD